MSTKHSRKNENEGRLAASVEQPTPVARRRISPVESDIFEKDPYHSRLVQHGNFVLEEQKRCQRLIESERNFRNTEMLPERELVARALKNLPDGCDTHQMATVEELRVKCLERFEEYEEFTGHFFDFILDQEDRCKDYIASVNCRNFTTQEDSKTFQQVCKDIDLIKMMQTEYNFIIQDFFKDTEKVKKAMAQVKKCAKRNRQVTSSNGDASPSKKQRITRSFYHYR